MKKFVLSALSAIFCLALWGCGASKTSGLSQTTWTSEDGKITFGKEGDFKSSGEGLNSGRWEEFEKGMIVLRHGPSDKEYFFYDISDDKILTLTSAHRESEASDWEKGDRSYTFIQEILTTDILYYVNSEEDDDFDDAEVDYDDYEDSYEEPDYEFDYEDDDE